jgi:hypothetical protein
VETTGADANEEFARWLAETAKAGETADQATPVQPGAPAAPPPAAPGAMPPPPSAGQPAPPSPEFFGADQLASPPTRPYEAPFAGPQIARASFQPAAGDPPLPPAPTPPPAAPVPPAAPPPAAPVPPVAPAPPAAPAQPAAPLPPAGQPAPPAWAPGYTGTGSDAAAAPEPPAPPAESTPFFPTADAAPVGFPPAPPPAAAPPAFPPLESPPAFESDPGSPAPGAPVPPSFPPVAPEPPAAPLPPAAPEPPPAPSYDAPYAQPAPVPPAAPSSDPYGALFDAGSSDTAARLAASPPPGGAAPPLTAPPVGERPSDEDPLSSLFGGLQTAEAPVAPTVDLFESTPVTPAPPVYVPEPAFTVDPVLPPAPAVEVEQPYEPAAPAPVGVGYAQTFSSSPPPDDDPTAGTQFFGGGTGEYEEPPDLDRTTVAEKVVFALAFLLPPVGLIGSIVAAAQSARRRGWVHGFVRTGLVISVITTIAAGIAGAYGYKALEDQQRRDSLVAASAQFCATIAEQPDMIAPPAFGFPGPGASIPETLEGIQAYIDRWDALASVSPSGIRPDVTRVADAARDIYETINTSRLVNNEQNIANMSSVAETTRIPAWEAEYC